MDKDHLSTTRAKTLTHSINVILKNGRRLLEDAEYLEYSEPPASSLYLIHIAEEEFAKAFLLCLVVRDIIPWHKHILRATKDHTCKQLLMVVMEHLNPTLEEILDRCDSITLRKELPSFPNKVADAMDIFRHEKIRRWESRWWSWAEDPEYDGETLAIAEGKKDRQKQDALYVRLGKDGSVASDPIHVRVPDIRGELERAERFASLVVNLMGDSASPGWDWDIVEDGFRALFTGFQDDSQQETRVDD